jgi:hypothetical protein
MSLAVTVDLLSRLLHKQVRSVSTTSCASGTQCLKLLIAIDGEKDASLFLKHFPLLDSTDSTDSTDDAITSLHRTAQRHEIAFYRLCAPLLSGVVPKLVASTDDGVLLLEAVRGQFFAMHQSEIDDATVGRFLSAFVKLHRVDAAPFEALLPSAALIRQNRQRRWSATAGTASSVERMQALCDKLQLSTTVTAALLVCARREYASMAEDLLPLEAPLTRATLHHGDSNPNNLVLCDDGRVVLFDFQEPCVDAPALDIAWLAITSLTPQKLRTWDDFKLLDEHFLPFVDIDRATFLESYRRALTLNASFIAFLLGPGVADSDPTSWPHVLLRACVAIFERQDQTVNTPPH